MANILLKNGTFVNDDYAQSVLTGLNTLLHDDVEHADIATDAIKAALAHAKDGAEIDAKYFTALKEHGILDDAGQMNSVVKDVVKCAVELYGELVGVYPDVDDIAQVRFSNVMVSVARIKEIYGQIEKFIGDDPVKNAKGWNLIKKLKLKLENNSYGNEPNNFYQIWNTYIFDELKKGGFIQNEDKVPTEIAAVVKAAIDFDGYLFRFKPLDEIFNEPRLEPIPAAAATITTTGGAAEADQLQINWVDGEEFDNDRLVDATASPFTSSSITPPSSPSRDSDTTSTIAEYGESGRASPTNSDDDTETSVDGDSGRASPPNSDDGVATVPGAPLHESDDISSRSPSPNFGLKRSKSSGDLTSLERTGTTTLAGGSTTTAVTVAFRPRARAGVDIAMLEQGANNMLSRSQ